MYMCVCLYIYISQHLNFTFLSFGTFSSSMFHSIFLQNVAVF